MSTMPDLDDIFSPENLDEGLKAPTLGPAYFAARDYVDRVMEGSEPSQFEPIVKQAADDFYVKLMESVQDYLIENARCNIQGEMWRMVDRIVFGLLSGERWTLEKYALGERYDCEKVRAAVAKHIPDELQAKENADLRARIDEMEKHIESLRRYR